MKESQVILFLLCIGVSATAIMITIVNAAQTISDHMEELLSDLPVNPNQPPAESNQEARGIYEQTR